MVYLTVFGALAFLICFAYSGFSVVIFAPIAAILAVLATDPSAVLPVFSSVFMPKMALFIELYFPVFLLGALFGKLMEISGFAMAIADGVIEKLGSDRAIFAVVILCAILTYGGVSLFVVVFTAYPFAASIFKRSDIPKRLIPGAIALGSFSFTMDALPGSPQIQNIIPTSFFGTSTWAAPILGTIASVVILISGVIYLNFRRRSASARSEGYGINLLNEPQMVDYGTKRVFLIAIFPLAIVCSMNWGFSRLISMSFGHTAKALLPGMATPITIDVSKTAAIWSVEASLIMAIIFIMIVSYKSIKTVLVESCRSAVGGALIAAANAASEFGFGSVIALLPGFALIKAGMQNIGAGPLVHAALSVTVLSGVTGSASGGLSIALGSMASTFIDGAHAAHIPMQVLHRIASMASGGMDTLPHNGGVITLLVIAGLTHKQSYGDIFAITLLKTFAVFFVIAVYYVTGWV